jgi:hypothetical protein
MTNQIVRFKANPAKTLLLEFIGTRSKALI